jgi:TctA family transporter
VRRGLVLTGGDPSAFFTRPIAFILFALVVLSLVGPTSVGRRAQQRLATLWRRT